jgi:multidrug efflux system membrane fusion protein
MIRAAVLLVAACVAGGGWYVSTRGQENVLAFLGSLRMAGVGERLPAAQPAAPRPEGANPIAVTTSPATTKVLPILRSSVGWIEAAARVTIRARMDGAIVERHVRDGAEVAAGDILFRLDDRELRAQIARGEATLARDRAVLFKLQGQGTRAQSLLIRNVGTQAQAEEAVANVRIAAAEVAASEAALEIERAKLARTTIVAPMGGRVGAVHAHVGDLVRGSDLGGDGLVTITQMTPLVVSFPMPERDLALLRATLAVPHRRARVSVTAGRDGGANTEAELSFIDSAVDPASGTVLVKATLAHSDSFWPGQYASVDLTLGLRPEAVTVPLVALQLEQDRPHVFVVQSDSTVALRAVEPIDTSGGEALIGKGLVSGERVVVEGHHRLRDGSPVAEKVSEAAALGATEPRPVRQ